VTSAEVRLKGSGSLLVRPVLRIAARIYGKNNGVRIKVLGGGTKRGIRSAGEERSDFGMASRDLLDEERERFPDLELHTIGFNAIALIANRANPVGALSRDQVRKIFSGVVTDWREVGGSPGEILLLTPDTGREAFAEFVSYFDLEVEERLDGLCFRPAGDKVFLAKTAETVSPEGLAIARVGKDANVITFVSVPSAEHAEKTFGTIKRLVLDGVPATIDAVRDGSYPVVQPLNIVTLGGPVGHVKGLIEYLLSDPGQKILENMNFIPARR